MLRMGRGKNEPSMPHAPEAARAPQPQPVREQPAGRVETQAAQPPARFEAQAAQTAAQPPAPARGPVEQSRAVSETDALARGMKEGSVGGFVGGAGTLSGEVKFRGMMRVDGRVEGRVNSEDGTLIVSAGGHVEAQVSVAVAKINGSVVGDVTASERIELGRTARVTGDLHTPALVVEQGAIFEGNCRMGARNTVRQKSAA